MQQQDKKRRDLHFIHRLQHKLVRRSEDLSSKKITFSKGGRSDMAVSVFWPSVQIDFFPNTLSHRISLLLFRVFFDKWSKVSCTARSVSVYLAKYKRTPCNYSFSSTLLLLCLPLLTVELRQAGGSLIVDFYIFGGILLETPQRDIAREVYSR